MFNGQHNYPVIFTNSLNQWYFVCALPIEYKEIRSKEDISTSLEFSWSHDRYLGLVSDKSNRDKHWWISSTRFVLKTKHLVVNGFDPYRITRQNEGPVCFERNIHHSLPPLPLSHLDPVYPAGHVHVRYVGSSMHVPPLRQESDAHSTVGASV